MSLKVFLSNLEIALVSLREQKFRTLLSALGITIGCLAIVLLVSIALGVRDDITNQVKDLGVNVLVVVPGRIEDGTFNPNLGGASYLKAEDADRLARVPGVLRAEPFCFVGGGIRYGSKVSNPLLAAATPGWFAMRPMHMQSGQTFTADQELSDVVVLGSIAKEQLFGSGDAIGKLVTINKREYRVVGVTEDKHQEQSLFSMSSLQNVVYIPYRRLVQMEPSTQTDRIMIQIRETAEPKQLVKNLDKVLGERLDRQQYQVLTQEDLLGLVYKLMGILTWLLTGLTSIALVVGGVGIMTVMLMSVNERAKEIGIRKTVGARKSDVFQQFLLEAIAVSFIGGLVGLALSYGTCMALRTYTPIKPLITGGVIGLALGVCIAIGTTFGLIPAMRAASKDPVVSLRQE